MLILLISMSSLEPLEYGITYNKFTKKIGKDIYESGRYMIGPFQAFIVYPANLVTIEFSNNRNAVSGPLQTRTAEGLALALHVSFQYQIIKDKIPDLYNLANVNYEVTLIRMARDVIMKVGGNYNATNYWEERRQIGSYMQKVLDTELQSAFTRCMGLQIIRIDLPKSYEDSIVLTQVEVQKTNMRKFEQTAELTRQNIKVLASEAQQTIQVVNATGNAEAYRVKQYAQAEALKKFIDAEAEIYGNVMKRVELKDRDFSDYVYYTSLMDQRDAKLLVGLENSIVNFNGNSVNNPVR